MIRPSLTTVLSARPWEGELVRAAQSSARVRVVARAYTPADVHGLADVIAIGTETAWISAPLIRSWKRKGHRVVGFHPPGDRPAIALLEGAGTDLILPDSIESVDALNRIALLSLDESTLSPSTTLTAVTGVQGAPGRSSIALAIAAGCGGVVVDGDPAGGLGQLLGLGPSPTVDKIQLRRATFTLSNAKPDRRTLKSSLADLRERHSHVVVDVGLYDPRDPILRWADSIVLVVDASTKSLTRTTSALMEWMLPQPLVVLNRVSDPSAVQAARYLLGVEPTAIIPKLEGEFSTSILEQLVPEVAPLTQ